MVHVLDPALMRDGCINPVSAPWHAILGDLTHWWLQFPCQIPVCSGVSNIAPVIKSDIRPPYEEECADRGEQGDPDGMPPGRHVHGSISN
jgi:hypothetical protein